ncbi:MAG: TniQ family protein [Gammaproteobacteria bacterium]|nr:TniQ family protein [Gammaproteobacteria bacterium]MBU1555766.1 TniQ family protein [Gammaproteobacteria bacterium]MBU2068776.1 TniQ family protein [Gammaproteobacteria bacterium]MBU2185214.1 TniQ family protein [Gammaproteobacteria bacterium]MBU2206299.1 TniQ family protein [Gammaproteobacteria bacterium]
MEFLSNPYPIRPRPVDGELFLGFVLRLADMNGRETLADLFCDFKSLRQSRCFFVRSDDFYRVLPYFAKAIDISCTDLRKYFMRDGLLHEVASNTFYRTKIGKPVFCPHCIAEHGYIKSKWLYMHINHCEVHECKLLHACLVCGAEQKWESNLLHRCTNCAKPWADVAVVHVALPAYEQTLAKMNTSQEEAHLEHLYHYVKFSMRPFDATYDKYHKAIEHLQDTSKYFEYAHLLATLDFVRQDYAKHRKRRFIKDLRSKSINKLLTNLDAPLHAANDQYFSRLTTAVSSKQHSVKIEIPEAATYKILTVNRRQQHAANDNRYHLRWEDSQRLLSMSRNTIVSLIESGVFNKRTHATSSSKLIAPPLNELVELHNRLRSIIKVLPNKPSFKTARWSNLGSYLGKKRTIAELLIAGLNREISIYISSSVVDFMIEELLFDVGELERFKLSA